MVRWVDSGLNQTGDPKDPTVGVPAVCETHGKVLSCEPDPALALPRSMSNVVLRLATNSAGRDDTDVDIFSIWWPSVVDVKVWK